MLFRSGRDEGLTFEDSPFGLVVGLVVGLVATFELPEPGLEPEILPEDGLDETFALFLSDVGLEDGLVEVPVLGLLPEET